MHPSIGGGGGGVFSRDNHRAIFSSGATVFCLLIKVIFIALCALLSVFFFVCFFHSTGCFGGIRTAVQTILSKITGKSRGNH